MKLAVLLSPHSNARYYESLRLLSLSELEIMLSNCPLSCGKPEYQTVNGLELLCMEIDGDFSPGHQPALLDPFLQLLVRHSSCMAVFVLLDGALYPLRLPTVTTYGADIAAILKYKGKTNERFTQLLINVALHSSAFGRQPAQDISLLDPMCGRGTTLLQAVRFGHQAAGVEIDKTDTKELVSFYTRYLEYHRVKHKKSRSSMTADGKNAGERTVIHASDTELTVIQGNTLDAGAFFKQPFHLIVSDLPYGIQHGGYAGKKRTQMDTLMRRALPVWGELLLPGGAIALSFNAHSISAQELGQMLSQSGFTPLTGGPYDNMRHWVEQAVDRDIVVATKE